MAHLTGAGLRAYAQAQIAYGERLVAAHSSEPSGCCRRCGRLAPCDRARHGQRLMGYFGGLLAWQPVDRPG